MLYVFTLAFVVGVGWATLYSVSLATITWIGLLGFLVAVVWRRSSEDTSPPHLFMLAVCFIAISLGLLRTESYKEEFVSPPLANEVGKETIFSGTVIREPDQRERTTHLYVSTGDEIALVTVDRHAQINYGDEVLVSGLLKKPESFETDLGRTFNYPGYLLARGVVHTVSFADVQVLDTGKGNSVISFLLKQKSHLMQGIESVIPEPQAGLAEGLLLGVKQALGDSLETDFRKSGIIHIVVLSGYNVMLVVAFFMFFLSRLFKKKWRMVIALLAIVGFALIVGLSATVVRACIMASLLLFADTFSKRYDVMRALFFAGFIMILINPFLLFYDIGFQLSFMATLGLLVIVPQFEKRLMEGTIFGIKEYVLATVSTQIAVLPLLLYHIGEISIVAIAVNVLVLPVVAAAMLGAFITGIIALWSSTLAMPFGIITTYILSYIILVATWFAALPIATMEVGAFSAYWVGLLYLGLGGILLLVQQRSFSFGSAMSDWEIVEDTTDNEIKESTLERAVVKKGAAQRAAPKEDLPIFFR